MKLGIPGTVQSDFWPGHSDRNSQIIGTHRENGRSMSRDDGLIMV